MQSGWSCPSIFSTVDYLGLGDDSLAQPISETMDDETENDTENGVKKAFGFESDLNQI